MGVWLSESLRLPQYAKSFACARSTARSSSTPSAFPASACGELGVKDGAHRAQILRRSRAGDARQAARASRAERPSRSASRGTPRRQGRSGVGGSGSCAGSVQTPASACTCRRRCRARRAGCLRGGICARDTTGRERCSPGAPQRGAEKAPGNAARGHGRAVARAAKAGRAPREGVRDARALDLRFGRGRRGRARAIARSMFESALRSKTRAAVRLQSLLRGRRGRTAVGAAARRLDPPAGEALLRRARPVVAHGRHRDVRSASRRCGAVRTAAEIPVRRIVDASVRIQSHARRMLAIGARDDAAATRLQAAVRRALARGAYAERRASSPAQRRQYRERRGEPRPCSGFDARGPRPRRYRARHAPDALGRRSRGRGKPPCGRSARSGRPREIQARGEASSNGVSRRARGAAFARAREGRPRPWCRADGADGARRSSTLSSARARWPQARLRGSLHRAGLEAERRRSGRAGGGARRHARGTGRGGAAPRPSSASRGPRRPGPTRGVAVGDGADPGGRPRSCAPSGGTRRAAAARIQASARGSQARTRASQRLGAATGIQASRGAGTRGRRALAGERRARAQAVARGIAARRALDVRHAAAT